MHVNEPVIAGNASSVTDFFGCSVGGSTSGLEGFCSVRTTGSSLIIVGVASLGSVTDFTDDNVDFFVAGATLLSSVGRFRPRLTGEPGTTSAFAGFGALGFLKEEHS